MINSISLNGTAVGETAVGKTESAAPAPVEPTEPSDASAEEVANV